MKIITITLSPAWDITYRVKSLSGEGMHRALAHSGKAGGKGINVSRAVCRAGGNCVTAAYLCGGTGQRIAASLAEEEIDVFCISGDGETRTNISVISEDGKSMEINAPGTVLSTDGLAAAEDLCASVQAGDVVCLCGSLPKNCPSNVYAKLCSAIRERGGIAVLDCDGEAMKIALSAKTPPSLIKPNREELAALAGCAIFHTENIPETIKKVCDVKKTAVLCTLGGDGAIYVDETGEIRVPSVKVEKMQCEKGAGDTFLGTFIWYHFGQRKEIQTAMKYAAGAAANLVAGK